MFSLLNAKDFSDGNANESNTLFAEVEATKDDKII